jgi:IS66 C-terminal element
MPPPRLLRRALPRRERYRRRRAARHIGGERGAHRVRAIDNGLRPPARYGQNDRAIAIGRKNYLFAGSDAGGRRAAAIYTLIESAKLNRLNPQHYLADVLARIADHPARRIAELLPWNWQPVDTTRAAA